MTTALILDLVQWVAEAPRPYGPAQEAWRTSCPRLTIWEDAVDGGLIGFRKDGDGEVEVVATQRGLAALADAGRVAQPAG
jgi:hypothetical protein